MKREIVYVKPNLNNLKGRRGRAVLEQIRNLPPVSEEEENRLRKEADECIERILARRRNEHSTGK